MGFLNFFSNKESSLQCLSTKIIDYSFSSSNAIKSYLCQRYNENSEEFNLKYIQIIFEFMYFFLHIASRSASRLQSGSKINALLNSLCSLTIDNAIKRFFDHWPEDLKLGIKRDFLCNLNNAEINYSVCTKIYLEPGQDVPILDRWRHNKKS